MLASLPLRSRKFGARKIKPKAGWVWKTQAPQQLPIKIGGNFELKKRYS